MNPKKVNDIISSIANNSTKTYFSNFKCFHLFCFISLIFLCFWVSYDKAPGTLLAVTKQGLEVACGDGSVLVVRELQAEGGKRMAAADYFRGHPIEI